ncbi:NAD(P)-dependent alcohol dehydrogenase [Labilibaculum euxinus]
MEADTMKAIIAEGYGNHDVLKLKNIAIPKPTENKVLVKVHACSATRADVMMLSGKPYFSRLFLGIRKPKYSIPGTGFAGEVVEVGSSVLKFTIGDAVFGETTLGFSTNAEYVTVPEDGVILHKPENLSYTDAAPFCDGHLTSINFLKEIGNVKPGQKVLINGASGSLGIAAVQLAKYFGAEVTTVCSTANVRLVKSLGADHTIDYTNNDFTKSENRYDIIYDTIGCSSFGKSKRILTNKGVYISPVLKSSLLLQMIRTSILGSRKAKFGASGLKSKDELRALLLELLEIFKSGKLKTVIDRQFPLEKVAHAHQYIATGHKKGNVVIIVES